MQPVSGVKQGTPLSLRLLAAAVAADSSVDTDGIPAELIELVGCFRSVTASSNEPSARWLLDVARDRSKIVKFAGSVFMCCEMGLTADDARIDDNYELREACKDGHIEIVRMLLALGLTAEDARARNNIALQLASYNGHTEVVRMLLALGLTADDVRVCNNFALIGAIENGHTEIVMLLEAVLVDDT